MSRDCQNKYQNMYAERVSLVILEGTAGERLLLQWKEKGNIIPIKRQIKGGILYGSTGIAAAALW